MGPISFMVSPGSKRSSGPLEKKSPGLLTEEIILLIIILVVDIFFIIILWCRLGVGLFCMTRYDSSS